MFVSILFKNINIALPFCPICLPQDPILPRLSDTIADIYLEGNPLQVTCYNDNFMGGPFGGSTKWLDPMGRIVGVRGLLEFNSVGSGQAGTYTCLLDVSNSIPGAVTLDNGVFLGHVPNVSFTAVVACELSSFHSDCQVQCSALYS